MVSRSFCRARICSSSRPLCGVAARTTAVEACFALSIASLFCAYASGAPASIAIGTHFFSQFIDVLLKSDPSAGLLFRWRPLHPDLFQVDPLLPAYALAAGAAVPRTVAASNVRR